MNKPDSNIKGKNTPSSPPHEEPIDTFQALYKCLKGVPLAQSGQMQEALEAFDGAIELDPSLASSWYNKGYVLTAGGLYKEALEAFEKAIEINPTFFHAWNGKGYTLYTLGRHQEALDAFERTIEINPSYAYPWNGIGNAHMSIGHYLEALETFNRAIEIDPKFALPWNGKAILLKIRPELETRAGHSAQQSFCRAVYLRQKYTQRFPLLTSTLADSVGQFNLPLLALQILLEMAAKNNPEYVSLYDQTANECKVPLAILSHLDSSPGLSNMDRSLWNGIVNYYHGNPLRAFEHFDAVDSSDETNLTGQYYLILSLRSYLESPDKEISFSLRQAEDVLKNSRPDITVEQIYYAGQIFCLALNWEQAMLCFALNSRHLPSLYMHHLCLRKQNNHQTADSVLNTILEEESLLAKQGSCGYMSFASLPEIDPALPDWTKNIQFYAHFMEIEHAVMEITKQDNLQRFPAYRELMQYTNGEIPVQGKATTKQARTWKFSKRVNNQSADLLQP
ncbi:MAG: tetratricopeptide repeat protein [Kiritimatiellae bacterium]|nr:tetratricopeptide repeat protein [Kiritimatiellia bacterium]